MGGGEPGYARAERRGGHVTDANQSRDRRGDWRGGEDSASCARVRIGRLRLCTRCPACNLSRDVTAAAAAVLLLCPSTAVEFAPNGP